jgi:two-component system, NarL family, nitrate/nitrite response regulator NarL
MTSEPTPASEPSGSRRLRVAIVASDPIRHAGLGAIVTGLGHDIAAAPEDADVVLADTAVAAADEPPVVTLGAGDAGQAGLLPADAGAAQIDAALRAASAGLIVRPPGSGQPAFHAAPGDDAPLLTAREIEVLAAIGDGLSNKAAARRLGISQHTVKFHLESLFRKLDASSRADAVHKGLRRGLIEL